MNINIKHLLLLLGVLFFLLIFPSNIVKAAAVNEPIILSIEHMGGEYTNRPLIKGLTPANTDVMVYLDGLYIGDAHVNDESIVTNNFYYQGTEPMGPGVHTVSTVAKDRVSLALSSFSNEITFTIVGLVETLKLPAPTLIEPNEDTITAKVKPFVKGLTYNNTYVHVIIDGVYNGKIKARNDISGTANFAYEPFLNLNIGEHRVWAYAEDMNGKRSDNSNVLYFNIEQPLPAPTLFAPVVNVTSSKNRPYIVGLAKNDLTVNIYIDHKLNGSFKVENHPSGTANFAYKPYLDLSVGSHLIYATAIDSRGKESRWSNLVLYNVGLTTPAITGEAASEEPIVKSEESEFMDSGEAMEGGESMNEEPETKENESMDNGLEEILNKDNTENGGDTGAINESKEQQGKLKLNLIIFILFLIAIIVWIFWVNRELIKERRAQADDEDKKDKNSKLEI